MKTSTMTGLAIHPAEALADQRMQVRSRLSAAVGRSRAALRRYREYRRGVAELHACSDRVLQDLGINRCDIERRTWAATYKR